MGGDGGGLGPHSKKVRHGMQPQQKLADVIQAAVDIVLAWTAVVVDVR